MKTKESIVVLTIDDFPDDITYFKCKESKGKLHLMDLINNEDSSSLEDTGNGYKFKYYINGKASTKHLDYSEIQELAALYKLIDTSQHNVKRLDLDEDK